MMVLCLLIISVFYVFIKFILYLMNRNFGYTHIYDVFTLLSTMIINTESIRFHYNNKNTVYFPAVDEELLDMNLILYKNKEIIIKMGVKHWWFAVFKLGMFSLPKEISMDINITFLNREKLDAFLDIFIFLNRVVKS